jgi:hypothetical protein
MREQAIVFGAQRHLVGVVTWPNAASGPTARGAVMSNVCTWTSHDNSPPKVSS